MIQTQQVCIMNSKPRNLIISSTTFDLSDRITPYVLFLVSTAKPIYHLQSLLGIPLASFFKLELVEMARNAIQNVWFPMHCSSKNTICGQSFFLLRNLHTNCLLLLSDFREFEFLELLDIC